MDFNQIAFGIELFVVIYSFLCCFFFSPTSETSEEMQKQELVENVDISQSEGFFFFDTEEQRRELKREQYELNDTIDTLTVQKARRIISLLQKQELLPNVNVRKKGMTREILLAHIKSIIPHHQIKLKAALSLAFHKSF